MRKPLGVVARAIRGRSSGLGWRGGATAAEPADVRCSKGWGALRAKPTGLKGRAGGGDPHRGSNQAGASCRSCGDEARRRCTDGVRCPGRCRGPPGLLIRRGDADTSCEREPWISGARGSKEASKRSELVSPAAATLSTIPALARVRGRAASLESLLG